MRRTAFFAALLGLACLPLVATAFGWRFRLHTPVVVQPALFDREFVFVSPCPPNAPLVPLMCDAPAVVSPVTPTVAFNESPAVQSAIYQGPADSAAPKAASPEMLGMPKKEVPATPSKSLVEPATQGEARPTPASEPKMTEKPSETKKTDSIPAPSPAVTTNPATSPIAPSPAVATPAVNTPTVPAPAGGSSPLKLDLPPLPNLDKAKDPGKPLETKPVEIPKPVESPIAEPKLPEGPAKPLIEPSISRYRHDTASRLGVKLIPVDGKPSGDQYTIGFYNYSPRSVELHVDEQTIVLKPQHSISVPVSKVFQYRLDNGSSESVTIPGESAGYEVVIRSSDGE